VLHFAAKRSQCCILRVLEAFPIPTAAGPTATAPPRWVASFLHFVAPFSHRRRPDLL
jgi:hypothetical protein